MAHLVIIGVYMTYNNNTQKNRDDYNSDLELILELSLNFKTNRKKVIICGDFNTDMSRQDEFTYKLNEMLVKLNFVVADLLWQQEESVNHTFFSKTKSKSGTVKIIKTWIDHFLVENSMRDIINCKIIQM